MPWAEDTGRWPPTSMKIVYVDETHPPDSRGSVSYTGDLAAAMAERGHSVAIATPTASGTTVCEERGVIVRRFHAPVVVSSAAVSPSLVAFLARASSDYDIVHLNHPTPSGTVGALIGIRRAHGPRRPALVVTFHAEVVAQKPLGCVYNRLITERLMSAADRIIVATPPMRKVVHDYSDKAVVIPYGMRTLCDEDAELTALPESFVSQRLRVLFVGRLVRYKGVPVLLEALRGMHARAVLVGSGPLRGHCERLAQEVGVQGNVVFVGHVPRAQLKWLYDWADVLVLPSVDRGEAFGYVLVEAMGQNTALITTELGTGTSWVNRDGETGVVVPPGDVDALAGALRGMDENRAALARFKEAGRLRSASFSLAGMIDQTASLYAAVNGTTKRA